jgi:hypothetical protein
MNVLDLRARPLSRTDRDVLMGNALARIFQIQTLLNAGVRKEGVPQFRQLIVEGIFDIREPGELLEMPTIDRLMAYVSDKLPAEAFREMVAQAQTEARRIADEFNLPVSVTFEAVEQGNQLRMRSTFDLSKVEPQMLLDHLHHLQTISDPQTREVLDVHIPWLVENLGWLLGLLIRNG